MTTPLNLVVIAIIAILAAILVPVFAQARDKARQTTCVSNLLETFTALHLSESTAARTTVEVGRLRAEELREAERLLQGEAVPRRTRWQPQRLYLSLDGRMTPLRDPWQRDGSQGPLHCR